MRNLKYNCKETPDKPKLREFYKITSLYSSKIPRSRKTKKGLGTVSDTRRLQRYRQLLVNATHDSRLGLGREAVEMIGAAVM